MVNETEGGIMLDTKMQGAINEQINWELYSGYLYLSMAAQFSELGMPGGQNWMTVQYQEELAHAQKMFDYVTTRGGRVTLEAIAKPQTEWAVGLDMFKEALAHEEKVTARIFDLASMALELKDHATHNFLQWFIAEQVEDCLLYTSDAADDLLCVDLGGRRIIKKKKKKPKTYATVAT